MGEKKEPDIAIVSQCLECDFVERHELFFENAVSGEIKFSCSSCGKENALIMQQEESSDG